MEKRHRNEKKNMSVPRQKHLCRLMLTSIQRCISLSFSKIHLSLSLISLTSFPFLSLSFSFSLRPLFVSLFLSLGPLVSIYRSLLPVSLGATVRRAGVGSGTDTFFVHVRTRFIYDESGSIERDETKRRSDPKRDFQPFNTLRVGYIAPYSPLR